MGGKPVRLSLTEHPRTQPFGLEGLVAVGTRHVGLSDPLPIGQLTTFAEWPRSPVDLGPAKGSNRADHAGIKIR